MGIFRQQNQEVLYGTFPTDINDDSSGYREVSFGKGKKERKILEGRQSLTIFLLSTNLAVDYVLGVDHTWS